MPDSECPEFAAIRRGDEGAYEKLFRDWYVPLCHFAYRYTKNEHAAEDVVQQFLAELWINRESRKPVHALRSYLFQSIRMRAPQADRTGIDRGRHWPDSSEAFVAITAAVPVVAHDDALRALEIREVGLAIDRAVDRLPGAQKAAVRATADLLGLGRSIRQQLAGVLKEAHSSLRTALAAHAP
jgi:DNA-directed RNA polymerase specialized sigma24 family protein